ncbi:hypothetical protein KC350_g77 [Hortaea werneckii]|nr:hypothetical protein KC350_g77 [Hortaea werneckii]
MLFVDVAVWVRMESCPVRSHRVEERIVRIEHLPCHGAEPFTGDTASVNTLFAVEADVELAVLDFFRTLEVKGLKDAALWHRPGSAACEIAAHQLGVVADKLIQNLAVILGELEKQTLHTSIGRGRGPAGVDRRSDGCRCWCLLQRAVAANHHERLNERQQNRCNVDHVAAATDGSQAACEIVPELFKRAALVQTLRHTLRIKEMVEREYDTEQLALLGASRGKVSKCQALKLLCLTNEFSAEDFFGAWNRGKILDNVKRVTERLGGAFAGGQDIDDKADVLIWHFRWTSAGEEPVASSIGTSEASACASPCSAGACGALSGAFSVTLASFALRSNIVRGCVTRLSNVARQCQKSVKRVLGCLALLALALLRSLDLLTTRSLVLGQEEGRNLSIVQRQSVQARLKGLPPNHSILENRKQDADDFRAVLRILADVREDAVKVALGLVMQGYKHEPQKGCYSRLVEHLDDWPALAASFTSSLVGALSTLRPAWHNAWKATNRARHASRDSASWHVVAYKVTSFSLQLRG